MNAYTNTRRRQAGYNLVEVLLAMAMLGVVTISIFTLFFMGRRNVYSGKQTSQAIAIATEVIEDLQPLNRQKTAALPALAPSPCSVWKISLTE